MKSEDTQGCNITAVCPFCGHEHEIHKDMKLSKDDKCQSCEKFLAVQKFMQPTVLNPNHKVNLKENPDGN